MSATFATRSTSGAVNCESHRRSLKAGEWKSVEINFEMRGSQLPVHRIHGGCAFRLVVQRTEVDAGTWTSPSPTSSTHTDASSQTTGSPRRRKSYATTMAEGKARRTSDIQNNDFGWAHQPFSFLKENTVFLIPHSHAQEFLRLPSEKDPQDHAECQAQLPPQEIPDFICHRAMKWIRTGRRPVLNLYTKGTTSLYSLPFRQDIFDSHTFPHWFGWGFYGPLQ